MQSTKYWIIVSILLAKTSRSEIIIGDRQDFAPAVEYLVNIVTSCYKDRVDGVGLSGNLPDSLIRTLAEHSIPVALTDDTAKSPHPSDRRLGLRFRHELRIFIIGASSHDHLYDILIANMHYGIWWNHMASYFILDSSPKCKYCVMLAYIAWKFNLINAKVLCLESRAGETLIVGFNPFTNQAPAPWGKIRAYNIPNEPPFAVFQQNCRKDQSICVNLDFDKTTDLAGYEFHLHGKFVSHDELHKTQYPFSYNFLTTNRRIIVTILDALHAKPKFFPPKIRHVIYEGGMSFTPKIINFSNSTENIIYPHALSAFVIVSKFRGNKSQLNKILTVVDVNSRYGIGVIYLITLIFFKFFARQSLGSALLNIVRITCNTSFAHLPNNTAARTFLTGLLFVVVTFQGIYQGNLASMLTTIIPLRNANTVKDLVELGYEKIYGDKYTKIIMDHPYIIERFICVRDHVECMNFAMNDLSACITITDGTIDDAISRKLHVGSKFIEPVYTSFPTRLFWPLKDRVDIIISRMVEGSVLEPWDVKCNPVKFTDFDIDEDVKANVDFKNIEMSEVAFAFIILGIGLVCATVTLVVELVVHRYQSRVSSVRVQVLN